jgi:hypothetical protein
VPQRFPIFQREKPQEKSKNPHQDSYAIKRALFVLA